MTPQTNNSARTHLTNWLFELAHQVTAWLTARPRAVVLSLAALHVVLAAGFSVVNPLGEAPDEADHWAYIVYLATERRLPEGPQVTQSKHPPAYHASAALAATLGEPDFAFLRANPDLTLDPSAPGSPNFFIRTQSQIWPWAAGPRAFHAARLWTVFLSGLTVLAAYGLSRAVLPAAPGLALLIAAVIACWPEFVFLGGALNNDTPVALWTTLALWGGLAIGRAEGRFAPGWWTPLALGLGLLTKLSAAAVWPAVGLAILLGRACARPGAKPSRAQGWLGRLRQSLLPQSRRRRLSTFVIVFGGALLMAAPWFWRNWRLYNDPLGIELARQTIDQRVTPWTWGDTLWLLEGWFLSFVGKFGAVGHIPYPGWVYAGAAFLALIALGGWIRLLVQARRRQLSNLARADWLPFLLLGMTVVAVAGGIWRYSLLALGTDQGRLLFPALVPILLLWLIGVRAWIPKFARPLSALGCFAILLSLTLYGLFGILRPAYAPPAPPAPAELVNLQENNSVQFGELTLLGARLESERPILYWQVQSAPTNDWRTILRVVAEDGSLAWEWRRAPGYGRYSTDRWRAGTIVRDEYAVQWPEWAGPGSYIVEVGLYPFGGDPVLPELQDGDSTHPYVYLGRLERAPTE